MRISSGFAACYTREGYWVEHVELQLILFDEFAELFFFILRFSRVRNLASHSRIVVFGFYKTTQKFKHVYLRNVHGK